MDVGIKGFDIVLSERTGGSTATFVTDGSNSARSDGGGSTTCPRCSPPVTPIAVPLKAIPLPSLEDQDDPTMSAVPVPRLNPQISAPTEPVCEGSFEEILKDPFPDTLISDPQDLQHALRAMCIQQQNLERRVMDSIGRVMDHLQKRLPEDVAKRVARQETLSMLVGGQKPAVPPHAVARASQRASLRASQTVPRASKCRRASREAFFGGEETTAKPESSSSSTPSATVKPEFSTDDDPAVDASKVKLNIVDVVEDDRNGSLPLSVGFASEGRESQTVGSESQASQRKSAVKIQGEMEDLAKKMEEVQPQAKQRETKVGKSSFKRGQKSMISPVFQDPNETLYEALISHPLFDAFCAVMILFNSILIGVVVDYETRHPQEEEWMMITGHACNIFFLVELLLRMWLYKWDYYKTDDRYWNIFDTILVTFSVIDVIMTATMGEGANSVGSGLKTIKMLRIVRIFRVFRFFRELSLLALMIADSIKSLMWALLMLTIIIYVFAIIFTQSCSDYVKNLQKEPDFDPADLTIGSIRKQFGSLPKTLYYLVLSMLGGISWGEVANTLLSVDWSSSFMYFFYIAFTILAVMNIITGVFVDNAVETAKSQRDFLIQRELELREKYVQEMRDLFHAMDDDGSGTVTWDEMDDHFTDPRVRGYFTTLGLEVDDMKRLFALVDDDCSGEVEVDEFLDGCMRLKGEAKSIDVHAIMHQCNKISMRVDHISDFLRSLSDDFESPDSKTKAENSYRALIMAEPSTRTY